MPKRKKKFVRCQTRGGNSKFGTGGEGFEFFPAATPTHVALAVTSIAMLSSKDISKRNLLSRLQQMELEGQVLKFSVNINPIQSEKKYLADLSQERRRDLIRVESKWIQVVADIEADACQRVDEAFDSEGELESITQRRIFASEIDCKKRIDHISC